MSIGPPRALWDELLSEGLKRQSADEWRTWPAPQLVDDLELGIPPAGGGYTTAWRKHIVWVICGQAFYCTVALGLKVVSANRDAISGKVMADRMSESLTRLREFIVARLNGENPAMDGTIGQLK